jgi:hypothetical protein
MLYCLGNNEEKSLYMFREDAIEKYFDLQLVKSKNEEPIRYGGPTTTEKAK